MQEKWAADIKAFEKGATWKVSFQQCETCEYFVSGNAKNCLQYIQPAQKPTYVLSAEKECPEFKHKSVIKICPKTKHEEQLLGGIFGFCVGDALGVPVEFASREKLKTDPLQEMRAYGTHHQHFGTWSDDTSMTLCLMESLTKGFSLKDVANVFCKFYYEKHWTPHNEVFDIGNTTLKAIEGMKRGIEPVECGGRQESDNGNGSLMRVLPLAFYLRHTEYVKKIAIIEEVSSLTHSHPRSKLACIFYVEMSINLFRNDKFDAFRNTADFINIYCDRDYHNEFSYFDRILKGVISLVGENEIRSTGYVIDSLEAALWAFMTTDNYKDAIFKAINLGGDTDTIAAITGGWAGIYYGIHSIPDNWVQCLARKNDIYKLIREFDSITYL